MGCHHGMLGAEMPWAELLAHLRALAGEFEEVGPVPDPSRVDLDPGESFPLLAGEREGRSYLLDTSFLLSGMVPDLVARLAARSGTLVIGCGAETVSGSWYLVAARGERLIHHYYACDADLALPYRAGEPLPEDPSVPLEDPDGRGLLRVMAHYGLDWSGWWERGPHLRCDFTAERMPEGGPLEAERDAHCRAHALAPEERPRLTVVVRGAPAGESWLERLLRRLFG